MSLNLTGVIVHNEYYSRHYLDALFENDLREVIARWEKTAADHPGEEAFRSPHARLRGLASPYSPQWQRNCALRTDFSRRWALVELDVLAARTLGLTLAELQTIYRIQVPVLRQYEADTWYDQKGRVVFTCSKGLPGVGFSRSEWEEIRNMASGTITRTVTDNTLPTGPMERTIMYHAPFTRCDREKDYAMIGTGSGTWNKNGFLTFKRRNDYRVDKPLPRPFVGESNRSKHFNIIEII